jgi:hypothetical protein
VQDQTAERKKCKRAAAGGGSDDGEDDEELTYQGPSPLHHPAGRYKQIPGGAHCPMDFLPSLPPLFPQLTLIVAEREREREKSGTTGGGVGRVGGGARSDALAVRGRV